MKGKVVKSYLHEAMTTPYAKFKFQLEASHYLQPGNSFAALDAMAFARSDNEAVKQMSEETPLVQGDLCSGSASGLMSLVLWYSPSGFHGSVHGLQYVAAGASRFEAYPALPVDVRTIQRWEEPPHSQDLTDRRATLSQRSALLTVNKLGESRRQRIWACLMSCIRDPNIYVIQSGQCIGATCNVKLTH